MNGVTVVIPVHNAGVALLDTVRSVLAQARPGRPFEVILVDDGSNDDAVRRVCAECPETPIVALDGGGLGAAAALNRGLAAARHPFIAQVDQDVVLAPGWLDTLLASLSDAAVAAAQGQYVTDPRASLLARVMGRDLQERYAALDTDTGHVCTGNVVYRAAALKHVGGFDATLGYGYDNDLSYRLTSAGYRLRYEPEARSSHRWREGFVGYVRQQYGFGYGRLDLVAKYRGRLAGDSVSPAMMMAHPVLTAAALGLLCVSAAWSAPAALLRLAAWSLLLLLGLERAWVGVRAARRFGDWVPLLFPVVHLVRDVVWVAAIVVWLLRRAAGVRRSPAHSMRPRRVGTTDAEPA